MGIKGRVRGRFGTIGSNIAALLALQLILVLGIISYAAIQDFRHSHADARAVMTTTAKAAAHYLAQDLGESRDSAESSQELLDVISVPEICEAQHQSDDEPADNRYMGASVYILKPDGSSACNYNKTMPSVGHTGWFKAVLASKGTVERGPIPDPVNKHLSVVDGFYMRKYHVVLAITTDLTTIGKVLKAQFQTAHLPPAFTVTGKDRKIEIGSTGGKTGRSLARTGFARPLTSAHNTFEDLSGTERIWGSATMADTNWQVFAGVSTSAAYAVAREDVKERVLLLVFVMCVVLLAAFGIQRRIARPVLALGKVTKKIAGGDADAVVVPAGPKELVELGESFNSMIGAVREVDQMRNAFLMAISHELRTPLTSVVGYAEFLDTALDTLSTEEIAMSLGAIRTQSQRLERLLLDLLDIERLSRGTIEAHRQETDIARLIDSAVTRIDIDDRLQVDVRDGLLASIDPALVERIVENLLVNAVKHAGDAAHIWVRAHRHGDALELVVEDSGHGVPEALKSQIFEPFKQGAAEHQSGTGVGLSLVTQFAKLHGGRAWVDDRQGGGAAFHVELPGAGVVESAPLVNVA